MTLPVAVQRDERGLARLALALLAAVLLTGAGWQESGGQRWRPLAAAAGAGRPGFTRLDAAAQGIGFTNALSDLRSITNRNLLSGAGVACGDVDGDGSCDLYFCGLDSDNRLYRNLGGWRFEEIPVTGGIGCPGLDATGAAFADVDGDGDADLLVNILGGGTRLFLNGGKGTFTDGTDAAGLRSSTGATSLALADVDGDGDLDLYVANFRPTTILDRPTARFTVQSDGGRPRVVAMDGRPVTEPDLADRFQIGNDGQVQENGEPDVLWINDGAGRFHPLSWTDGAFLDEDGRTLASPPRDWGLAARFHDVDRDGDPDLYVCNDLWTPDRLWINESTAGRVRFRAIGSRALRNNPTFSMGADFGDLNLDGIEDFHAVDMLSRSRRLRQTQLAAMAPEVRPPGLILDRVQMKRNVLEFGRPDGSFSEVAHQSGVQASEWSWGPLFLDVDLDGDEDILIPTGQHRDFQDADGAEQVAAAQRGGRTLTPGRIQELVRALPRLLLPNVAFRNRGDGTFEEVAGEWGFADPAISQGAALADLDDDGDLDVVVNRLFEGPGLFRNESTAPRVAVELAGPRGNTAGIGARVEYLPAPGARVPLQSRQWIAGGRYLSGDQARRMFAAGGDAEGQLRVHWPGGPVTVVEGVRQGRLYSLVPTQPGATSQPQRPPPPLFEDVSDRIRHVAHEDPFEDFERQPLLPHRLSTLGPGVTWTDLDADGLEDLVLGTGKGGTIGVYLGRAGGAFERMERPPFNRVTGRDLTTVLPFGGVLFAGVSNLEDGLTNGGCVRILDAQRGVSGEALLAPPFSTGPLAAADLDGDGTLELFIGGRSIPGRFPEPASAFVVRSAAGRLTITQRLEALGLVSGACFSDLDGDGDPDLVLARQWAPLGFLRNDAGRLVPWEPEVRAEGRPSPPASRQGLWNGIAAGDFDGDGRMDLVASNWGRNTELHVSPESPRRLYFGDLGGAGLDLFETQVDPVDHREWPVRELPLLRMVLPARVEAFATHAAFADADADRILGSDRARLGRVEVTLTDGVVLLNRGDHFDQRPLPAIAQRAPAFGVCVADANGDGHEDCFLAQNWFSAHPSQQRNDGGRGVWLLGDGKGGFVADESTGVVVLGEGRGAAVADFDGDGRVDLAVAQNAAATTLWRNVGARPGLRVRLMGPAGNPSGIGCRVRVHQGERPGPVREIHAGSGHWSVDSAVSVLGLAGVPTTLEVRWPGRAPVREPVPAGAREITVRY